MSYDVTFRTENEARKNILLSKCNEGTWRYDYVQKYGVFFDLCGWSWSEFIREMRAEIGCNNSTYEKDNYDFCVRVGDLRKIADTIKTFENTEGARKINMYVDLFGFNGIFVYDPDTPFPTTIRDENPNSCWLTIEQVYEMNRILCGSNSFCFMEKLWDIFQEQGFLPYDFSEIVEEVFADAPDDELVFVEESY